METGAEMRSLDRESSKRGFREGMRVPAPAYAKQLCDGCVYP